MIWKELSYNKYNSSEPEYEDDVLDEDLSYTPQKNKKPKKEDNSSESNTTNPSVLCGH